MTSAVTVLQKLRAVNFKALNGILRPNVFKQAAGAILVFNGLAGLMSGLGHNSLLDMPDPILGLSIRHLMLVLGLAQLLVGILCLFSRQIQLGLWLAAWLGVNFLAYRIGLWTEGWHHSSGFLFGQLGCSLQITDYALSSSSVLLVVGSATALWFQNRKTQADEFSKMSCPSCGAHIRFSVQNIGQIIPCPRCQKSLRLERPKNLKMACFFCKGHIQFPSHAIGEKMPCPHCNMDITLKEPA